ncbi:MAG: NAD(+) synthase [Bacteriovoracaceae bacterium]|nr:NAD(+) synthase [Bacteriovoracaceae bacterium]
MKILIHQTHHQIADFENIFSDLKSAIQKKTDKPQLHLFPELYLTGYPLQDLCLQPSFYQTYLTYLNELNQFVVKQKPDEKLLLVSGLQYTFDDKGLAQYIRNVIYEIRCGKEIKAIYTKMLLPNYDIFDEKKYFTPGTKAEYIEFAGKKIALQICEDMWASTYHDLDPTVMLKGLNINFDLVINLSASPFNLFKSESRFNRAKEISKTLKAPFVYVNRVGAEDEILFDGNSFIVNNDEVVAQLKSFAAETKEFALPKKEIYPEVTPHIHNHWEELFSANIVKNNKSVELKPLNDENCQALIDSLIFGYQEYAKKTKHQKFTVALSGGMDSALVLTILKLGLQAGQTLEALYMPSRFSSDLSRKLSEDLCKKLDIPLYVLPIEDSFKQLSGQVAEQFDQKLQGLALENIQSRLRGLILYTRSNQTGSMVINTSNKSELAVGYSTLYGDSVGALSLLGDIYKTEIYQLAKYINKKYNNCIPEQILSRPPTAELRENQKDQDSLPEYNVLDIILEGILSYRFSAHDLIKLGINTNDVQKVFKLYAQSEFKRKQFCPILKVKGKSFGFGYRIPLTKNSQFYSAP